MTTSGTFNFSLDIDEVIQEATEMIGGEITLGHEPKSARRSINLMLQDWQNRGILLWTADTTTVSVSTSVTAYDLGPTVVDVLETTLKRNNIDIQLERISMEEYAIIPNKGQTGRPSQYAVRRNRNDVTVYVWPIPENNTDVLNFEKVRYLEDVTKSAIQTADISRRFLPCLTAGLAYQLSLKRPGVEGGRIQFLKAEYEERLARAMEEDRERASLKLVPKLRIL